MTEQEIIDQAIEIKHCGDFIEVDNMLVNVKHIKLIEPRTQGDVVWSWLWMVSDPRPRLFYINPQVLAFKIKLMQGYEE